ncbi:MAG: DUF1579 domain-containing protein [Planctomycetes bacterium]|nr:DUF1579 domain-containing protein [Planctomycetota bacterium]
MRTRLTSLAIIAACAIAPLTLRAAEHDQAAMGKAMAQMSTVGPEHAALKQAVGEWDVDSSMFMDPAAPPMKSKGKATFTAILEGKWVKQEYQGEMMGKAFAGVGINGYDTVAKRYVGSWYDSFSTALSNLTGESKDGGKTITFLSHLEHCPMTGGPLDQRMVLTHESADKMTFVAFHTPKGGAEMKSMELVYTRAKTK